MATEINGDKESIDFDEESLLSDEGSVINDGESVSSDELIDEQSLDNDEQSLSSDAELIEQRKAEILQRINADPRVRELMAEGLLDEILIDKDTYDISELPKDRQYFFICITTIPILRAEECPPQVLALLDEMAHVASKYFEVNDLPVQTNDEDMDCYWLSIPILY
jgi:hypothetical protein